MNIIMVGDVVEVVKGNKARSVQKGDKFRVLDIIELGHEYSHQVQVRVEGVTGRRMTWYARHRNRLNDPQVNLNDGNPLHKITVRRLGMVGCY